MVQKKSESSFNSGEVIGILGALLKDKRFKKTEPLPCFTEAEMKFLVDLIFFKRKDVLFDFFLNEAFSGKVIGMSAFNGPSLKKLLFLSNLVRTKFNGTRAAALAGYRFPKQEAWRLRQQIAKAMRNYQLTSADSKTPLKTLKWARIRGF